MKAYQEIPVLDYIYHHMPERVKLGFDIGAGATAVSAFFGAWSSFMGAIGATAATTYAVLRLYYFIKDKRAGK